MPAILKCLISKIIIPLKDHPITIGSKLESDFCIPERNISSTHCIIRKFDDGWIMEDNSLNGTLVNDKLFIKTTSPKLQYGDIIHPSNSLCRYRFDEMEHLPPNSRKFKDLFPIENKQFQFNAIEEELVCQICKEMFIKSKSLNCGHELCYNCRKDENRCPICGKRINSSSSRGTSCCFFWSRFLCMTK